MGNISIHIFSHQFSHHSSQSVWLHPARGQCTRDSNEGLPPGPGALVLGCRPLPCPALDTPAVVLSTGGAVFLLQLLLLLLTLLLLLVYPLSSLGSDMVVSCCALLLPRRLFLRSVSSPLCHLSPPGLSHLSPPVLSHLSPPVLSQLSPPRCNRIGLANRKACSGRLTLLLISSSST